MVDRPTGTVTFLFTDIEGSTRLLERLRERYDDALSTHARLLREAFAEFEGHEIDTQGDAFFVAFPRARDAVAAAVAAQRALAAEAWPDGGTGRVRMGLHTGGAGLLPRTHRLPAVPAALGDGSRGALPAGCQRPLSGRRRDVDARLERRERHVERAVLRLGLVLPVERHQCPIDQRRDGDRGARRRTARVDGDHVHRAVVIARADADSA